MHSDVALAAHFLFLVMTINLQLRLGLQMSELYSCLKVPSLGSVDFGWLPDSDNQGCVDVSTVCMMLVQMMHEYCEWWNDTERMKLCFMLQSFEFKLQLCYCWLSCVLTPVVPSQVFLYVGTDIRTMYSLTHLPCCGDPSLYRPLSYLGLQLSPVHARWCVTHHVWVNLEVAKPER